MKIYDYYFWSLIKTINGMVVNGELTEFEADDVVYVLIED